MQGLRHLEARSYNGTVIVFLASLQCQDQLVGILFMMILAINLIGLFVNVDSQ